MITEPGIYHGLNEATYHADLDLAPELGRSLSSSGAKTILKSPAHFAWQLDHPTVKDAFDFGTVVHALTLGSGDFIVVNADAWTSKAAREARDEIRASGRTPILAKDRDRAQAAANAVKAHRLAGAILSQGAAEVSLYWTAHNGVTCRGRVDWLHDKAIVDLKTVQTADPREFARTAWNFGYHQQAAWYVDGLHTLTGERLPFLHVLVEKDPPHLVSVVQLDDDYLAYGRAANDRALDLYAECVAADEWPAYGDDITTIAPPKWAR